MMLFFAMKQLGREEDCFWKDSVPEPHHTYYTMGETHQVHLHTHCTSSPYTPPIIIKTASHNDGALESSEDILAQEKLANIWEKLLINDRTSRHSLGQVLCIIEEEIPNSIN